MISRELVLQTLIFQKNPLGMTERVIAEAYWKYYDRKNWETWNYHLSDEFA